MKMIFPQGEHAPWHLSEGKVRVGSGPDCDLRIAVAGVAAHHCEIEMQDGNAVVRPLDATAPTVLNGRQVEGSTAITPGDLLLFGRVGCRIVAAATPATTPTATAAAARAPAGDVAGGHTVLRMAVPRVLLRGVSGPTFGKTFALSGSMIMGRQPECDIPVPSDEVSRKHARLTAQTDGVVVDDLGSANGTFVNDKRVQNAVLHVGDELRLDTVRFQLSTPGSLKVAQTPLPVPSEAAGNPGGGRMLWFVAACVLVVVLVAVAGYGYFG
jgi:pSer/pThr/pTyr-binding forkhead associated (FHA) protein